MPSGKETRLLHLSEMEKLDKTLFRLEQGRPGAAGCGLLGLLFLLLGGEPPGPGEREMAGSSPPSSGSNGKGALPALVFSFFGSVFLFFFFYLFPCFSIKQFLTCLLPLQSSMGSGCGSVWLIKLLRNEEQIS